jgi:hypothetical protein
MEFHFRDCSMARMEVLPVAAENLLTGFWVDRSGTPRRQGWQREQCVSGAGVRM